MPEEVEVPTDKLDEDIHSALEKEGSAFLRRIALSTTFLAAFAAIAALEAGATVNEALIMKTESARLQSQASDQWAFFQAKGIKAAIHEAAGDTWEAAGKEAPKRIKQEIQRYGEEQREIKAAALEKEKERDEKIFEANHLLHNHHFFANSVALFQVAIALGALAALTRNKTVWFGSLLMGGAGISLLAVALLR